MPDAEAIARDAIEEVKRESVQAQRALDERRLQAKVEVRRVADRRHRKTTRGMKKKAIDYGAQRSRAKLIAATAALAMIGIAALIGTQDLPLIDGVGAGGAVSQVPK